MASVQTGLVLFFMRKLKGRAVRFMDDIPALRIEKERMFSRVKCPYRVIIDDFDIGEIEAAKFTPIGAKHKHKVVLYLHGGGYVTGSIKSHAGLIGKLALSTGIPHVAINYRLAPEHPYPAALDDAIAAYQWLQEQGYRADDILLSGDSAGGGLVLATLLKIKALKLKQPLAAITLSPWTDLTVTGESATTNPEKDPLLDIPSARKWGLWYTGGNTKLLKNPFVSPLQGDLEGLAPILMHVGTSEILLSDSISFATKAAFTNTTVELEIFEEMPHVFQFCWQYLSEGKQSLQKIADFAEQQILENEKERGFLSANYQSREQESTTIAWIERSWEALKMSKKIVKNTLNR